MIFCRRKIDNGSERLECWDEAEKIVLGVNSATASGEEQVNNE
jgi:hypothetical protein